MYVRGTEWEQNRTLPRVTAAHADVANVTRLDDIVESLHLDQLRQSMYFAAVEAKKETYGFFDWGLRIEPFA
jgi:hypothetical protein